ncbi:MAG: hypothetical protein DHS20C18_11040 [Saprospiraceae bacterium]|nr:MAG: hypothetical protein DHS20C18_11040 [Saprospiraceae bacterium]
MPINYQLKTPFEDIALSLSGGGYRAAAFHLGSMAYLHRAQYKNKALLEHVRIISTVSGGTITGVFYAYWKQEKKSFPEIYKTLLKLLDELDLIQLSMTKLRTVEGWPEHKRRNIINAFATIYDEKFTKGGTFSSLEDMSDSHLREVVFNATEFNNGLLFRFQNARRMGNGEIIIPKQVKPEIKLGDIIAASSCFPGGFEPIAFPDDFLHKDAKEMAKLKDEGKFETPFGLMDGGICDNQGISSIISSERSLRKEDKVGYYYDLVIISDVASPFMAPFQFTMEGEEQPIAFFNNSIDKISKKINRYYKGVLFSLAIILFLSVLSLLISKGNNNWMLGAGIVGLLFSGPALFAIWKTKKETIKSIKGILKSLNEQPLFPFFMSKIKPLGIETLTIKQISRPLLDRIGSFMTLVQEVFLKQIRRLIYSDIYNTKKWQYRRISNLIYELGEPDFLQGRNLGKNKKYGPVAFAEDDEQSGPEVMEKILGTKIPKVAGDASGFGTTLWFTKDEQDKKTLDSLVATGQFTMCYNLIYYINLIKETPEESGYAALSKEDKEAMETLYAQLIADWALFRKNPRFMVDAV